jgi:hypothetical protein
MPAGKSVRDVTFHTPQARMLTENRQREQSSSGLSPGTESVIPDFTPKLI